MTLVQDRKAAPGHKQWERGVALAREGKLEPAAQALRQAVRQGPTVALYWLNLASVLRRQRQLDEALRCAHRAFELDRHNMLALRF